MIIKAEGINVVHSSKIKRSELSSRKTTINKAKKYDFPLSSLSLSKETEKACRKNYVYYLNDTFRKII